MADYTIEVTYTVGPSTEITMTSDGSIKVLSGAPLSDAQNILHALKGCIAHLRDNGGVKIEIIEES